MLSIQHLYHTLPELELALAPVDKTRNALVQIFTCDLEPEAARELAGAVRTLLPQAEIIGTSVNGLIYKGEQFDKRTMLTVEQYEKAVVRACLLSTQDSTYIDHASQIYNFNRAQMPQVMRMFVGAYYEYSHQLVNTINAMMPGVRLAGGVSGEVEQFQTVPFVFNAERVLTQGLIFAGIYGEHLSLFSRIHSSVEEVGPVYTVTATNGTAIDTIENQPAETWLENNLGFLNMEKYSTWEQLVANDPLVRFQLSLTSHPDAVRYMRYDAPNHTIATYFNRIEAGTKFKISYTTPAKCVEECFETCKQVEQTSMEQLFCYSCLFRKLYLKNCAKWEISPFHKNPVSGVFLLGEFGYSDGANAFLNGSCVLEGIGEGEQYLEIDALELNKLGDIYDESEDLFDFIVHKQSQASSAQNRKLLDDMIAKENLYHTQRFQYTDPNLRMSNLLKYEMEKDVLKFNKLCLIKIENADTLMSYLGATAYYSHLKDMITFLNEKQQEYVETAPIRKYSLNVDTFALAANDEVSQKAFTDAMKRLQQHCQDVHNEAIGSSFLVRLIVVMDDALLLEQAYSLLEQNKNSQSRIIVNTPSEVKASINRDDLESLHLIQYALAHNTVIPYYQGIYNNETGKIDCYEALMRLRDATGKVWAPGKFMDVAKKYRLYLDLNLKMFESVLCDFGKLDCAVNMNISAHDITSPRFRAVMAARLPQLHNPSNLTFEILEDEYFKDMEILKEFITEARGYGVKIAIDDFGSGYSNLLEIIKICPDYLKIDGQIICEIHKSYENEVIVDVIAALGKKLSIDLVAEFVENAEIQKLVEKYNVKKSQGYHFSKPMPLEAIIEKIQ